MESYIGRPQVQSSTVWSKAFQVITVDGPPCHCETRFGKRSHPDHEDALLLSSAGIPVFNAYSSNNKNINSSILVSSLDTVSGLSIEIRIGTVYLPKLQVKHIRAVNTFNWIPKRLKIKSERMKWKKWYVHLQLQVFFEMQYYKYVIGGYFLKIRPIR